MTRCPSGRLTLASPQQRMLRSGYKAEPSAFRSWRARSIGRSLLYFLLTFDDRPDRGLVPTFPEQPETFITQNVERQEPILPQTIVAEP